MKRKLLCLLLALTPLFAMAANKQVVVLSCDIHCQGCIDRIMKNIAFEKGVKDIVCDLKTKTVTVKYNADKTDVPTLLRAFEKIGKPATVIAPKEDKPAVQKAQTDRPTDANTGATQPAQ